MDRKSVCVESLCVSALIDLRTLRSVSDFLCWLYVYEVDSWSLPIKVGLYSICTDASLAQFVERKCICWPFYIGRIHYHAKCKIHFTHCLNTSLHCPCIRKDPFTAQLDCPVAMALSVQIWHMSIVIRHSENWNLSMSLKYPSFTLSLDRMVQSSLWKFDMLSLCFNIHSSIPLPRQ